MWNNNNNNNNLNYKIKIKNIKLKEIRKKTIVKSIKKHEKN
jgi:hypothetical protein